MSKDDLIIEAKDVVKTYKQGPFEVHALRGINVQIERGDFAVIAGSSGSGKTTLLNLIGGLDTPTSGQLSVDGESLEKMSSRKLADLRLRRIGFVFQAYNLIPVLSAYENAEYVLLLQGMAPAERKKRVESVLHEVGLEGMTHRRPSELSGGQQQRVAVARAIASEPALVLADEPTANLDSKTGTELIDLMISLNQERGVTFLISSHDPKVIDRAYRVISLEDGRIVSDTRRKEAA